MVTAQALRPAPRLVESAGPSWLLHDIASTRRIEGAALARTPVHGLMQRAGEAVARVALAVQPRQQRAIAFVGPGNNGGDALIAARALQLCGWRSDAVLLAEAGRLPADAAWALECARQAGVRVSTTLPAKIDAALAIDGLLGLGATRPPQGPLASATGLLACAASSHVIAVDLPTGLDGDTGRLLGEQAVRAHDTVALLTLKPGLFTASGRDHAGRVWFDDLGVHRHAELPWRLLGGLDLGLPGQVPHVSHKGSFGDLCVTAPEPTMAGAAWLAARSALAAGAGRVYMAQADETLGSTPELKRGSAVELMAAPASRLSDPRWLRARTVVAGCGGGQHMAAQLPAVLTHAARLVLDADALNAVAADAKLRGTVQARRARGLPTVLTPHPLEAARLLGTDTKTVQADRLSAATRLARELGATVVLKGSGTVLADADGRLAINSSGNALLASPGSGDVLAGWIGGSWSRCRDQLTELDIASAAVWRHGRAAELAAAAEPGLPNLLASELIDAMRRITPRA